MKGKILKHAATAVSLVLLFFVGIYLNEFLGWLLAVTSITGGHALMAAALVADRITPWQDPDLQSYPVAASTKIYQGAVVMINSSGFAVPAADAAGGKVVGIAEKTVDNSAGANGDLKVNCRRGVFLLNATSITQAMVGTVMYVVDDNTIDDATGTNSIKAGRLVEFVTTTSGWVLIEPTGVGV